MTPTQLAAPFLGAAIIEAIHWYQLRTKLSAARWQRILKSPLYWGATAAMILLGGLGTIVLFGGAFNQGQLLLAGAGFPTIFTKLVAAFTRQHVTYGAPGDEVAAEPQRLTDFFVVS